VVWIGGLLLTALVTAVIGRVALRMLGEAGATVDEAVKGTPKINGTAAEPAEACEVATPSQ
jgi:hypothetical protein